MADIGHSCPSSPLTAAMGLAMGVDAGDEPVEIDRVTRGANVTKKRGGSTTSKDGNEQGIDSVRDRCGILSRRAVPKPSGAAARPSKNALGDSNSTLMTASMRSFGDDSFRELEASVAAGTDEGSIRSIRMGEEPIVPKDAAAASAARSLKSVSYGCVEVRRYARELGDNPSCGTGGPPVTLAWNPHRSTGGIPVDDYEASRLPLRRSAEQMVVPPQQREEWLTSSGYSRSEIWRASKSCEKIQREREETLRRSKFFHIEVLIERIRRKSRKVTRKNFRRGGEQGR